jgi:hypothetical protein
LLLHLLHSGNSDTPSHGRTGDRPRRHLSQYSRRPLLVPRLKSVPHDWQVDVAIVV